MLRRLDSPKAFLSSHKISNELRAKMVDWMMEVISGYYMSEECFFKAVLYMDKFLEKTPRRHEPGDIHLVGVVSMLLASKYEEVHAFKVNTVYEKIAHRKLFRSSILQKEVEMLEVLGFSLEKPTIYDLLKHVFCNTGIMQTHASLA